MQCNAIRFTVTGDWFCSSVDSQCRKKRIVQEGGGGFNPVSKIPGKDIRIFRLKNNDRLLNMQIFALYRIKQPVSTFSPASDQNFGQLSLFLSFVVQYSK